MTGEGASFHHYGKQVRDLHVFASLRVLAFLRAHCVIALLAHRVNAQKHQDTQKRKNAKTQRIQKHIFRHYEE